MLISQRGYFLGCSVTVEAAPTREGIDVNHCVLARLVVNNNINAKQRHAQRLPQ